MTKFGDWLRVTTFCDCEEWCVHAEVQRVCAQLEEDARRRHDYIFAITSSKGHDCAANAEAGNLTCQAFEAARELMEKYSHD